MKFPTGSCREWPRHPPKPKGLAAQLRHLWKGVQSWGESDQSWEFTAQTGGGGAGNGTVSKQHGANLRLERHWFWHILAEARTGAAGQGSCGHRAKCVLRLGSTPQNTWRVSWSCLSPERTRLDARLMAQPSPSLPDWSSPLQAE